MRECVFRAVGVLQDADLMDISVDLSNADNVTRPSIAVVAQHLMAKRVAPTCVRAWRDWVLSAALFDSDGRLRSEVSKAHKQHVRVWLQHQMSAGVTLPRSVHAALSACKKRESLERIVLRTLCQYKTTDGVRKKNASPRPTDV